MNQTGRMGLLSEAPTEAMVSTSQDFDRRPANADFFWRGRRVFLTGQTGFKGGWLTL